ncbi:MAG: TadE/TadG family type IV pilus assembly protein [Marmoricola sp.]
MWPVPTTERRGEPGAVAVEAALVIPLLCILVFGMIEFAFVMRDYASVSNSVRTGSRIASTGADAGPGTCETGTGAPPCTSTSSPALAQEAADAIQRSGSAMPPDSINYMLVYKANPTGYPGVDANRTMPTDCSATANCVKFIWRPTLNAFKYSGGSWSSVSISACFPGSVTYPMDRVGVYLNATHKMMTGLFGAGLTLNDRAVLDFEPLATQNCGANQHQ